MPLADADDARALLVLFGGWFGPPALVLGSQTLDGRKRSRAFEALFHAPTPVYVARDALDAVRFLVAAEHFDRALETMPPAVPLDNQLSALLRLDPARVAPLLALARRQRRHQDRRKRRRTQVVTAVRQLYVASLEGHVITSHELRDALGEWL